MNVQINCEKIINFECECAILDSSAGRMKEINVEIIRDKTCYIVGAGDFGDETLMPRQGDLVIAADGGLRHLLERGIAMDLAVGDFDSLGYVPQLEHVTVLQPEKDDTDMNHALEMAWERGYRQFCFYGCTGGRTSHTIANIQMLDDIARRGGEAMLVGVRSEYHVVRDGSIVFPAGKQGYLSVFCLGDRAEGVDLRGLKYELTDAVLNKEFPLGVSNEFTGREASVSVNKGSLLLIYEY